MSIPFLLLIVATCYLAWRTMRSMRRNDESPDKVMQAVAEVYEAVEINISLKPFAAFTENMNPRLIKALRINNDLIVCFVEYTYIVKSKTRYSPPEDVSVYAFYLIPKNLFDSRKFNEVSDTKEVGDEYVLVRFDRVPVSQQKTLGEIEFLLNKLN